MLRDLYSRNIAPRLFSYSIDISSGSPVASVGKMDLTSIDDNGTGDISPNFKLPFGRNCLVALGQGSSGTAGGWAYSVSVAAQSTARISVVNAGGTPEDKLIHALVFGYRSPDVSRTIPQIIKGPKTRGRLLSFQITGATPTLDIGKGAATLTKAATGDYTLTFKNAFSNIPVAIANGAQATAVACRIESVSATAVRIKVFTAAGAAADAVIGVLVYGADTREDTPFQGSRSAVNCQARKPRMLGFRLPVGGATVTIGSEHGTSVNNGTGDYTITFLEPFRQTPVAIATGVTTRAQVRAITSTTVRVITTDSGGNPTSGGCDVIILGSLDPSEY